jgi:hypothetical protein
VSLPFPERADLFSLSAEPRASAALRPFMAPPREADSRHGRRRSLPPQKPCLRRRRGFRPACGAEAGGSGNGPRAPALKIDCPAAFLPGLQALRAKASCSRSGPVPAGFLGVLAAAARPAPCHDRRERASPASLSPPVSPFPSRIPCHRPVSRLVRRDP